MMLQVFMVMNLKTASTFHFSREELIKICTISIQTLAQFKSRVCESDDVKAASSLVDSSFSLLLSLRIPRTCLFDLFENEALFGVMLENLLACDVPAAVFTPSAKGI